MAETSLPEGSVVLHIGPHKTGTTTLQAGLGQNREALRDQGVVYPGRGSHELNAAMAIAMNQVDPGQDLEAARSRWYELLEEIRAAQFRFGVLSSEFYSETPPERIGWLVDSLGPDVQVVVTLRPLAKILTSQWQQFVQNQIRYSWDDWLKAILADATPGSVTPSFWRRHRHDLLVRRWLDVVGPDRLTVIAINDQDPQFLLRSFEDLLGVRDGTLTPSETRANRSLTLEEVELVRAFNKRYRAAGFKAPDYTRLIRYGAVRYLQRGAPDPADHRIVIPSWAVGRVTEISADMVQSIASSGARVIGPLSGLADPTLMPTAAENVDIAGVDHQLVARFAAGLADSVARISTTEAVEPQRKPIQAAVQTDRRRTELARAVDARSRLQNAIADLDRRIDQQRMADEVGRAEIIKELVRRSRRYVRRRIRRTS